MWWFAIGDFLILVVCRRDCQRRSVRYWQGAPQARGGIGYGGEPLHRREGFVRGQGCGCGTRWW